MPIQINKSIFFVKQRELKLEAPTPSIWCCINPPTVVTVVTVVSVQGLATTGTFQSKAML